MNMNQFLSLFYYVTTELYVLPVIYERQMKILLACHGSHNDSD